MSVAVVFLAFAVAVVVGKMQQRAIPWNPTVFYNLLSFKLLKLIKYGAIIPCCSRVPNLPCNQI